MIVDASVMTVAHHPGHKKGIEGCLHTEIKVPTNHDGEYDVTVLVHTPKSISKEACSPAIIYAHGGGVAACSALMFKPYLSNVANECGVVVYNVDYRLAPETKCPNNMLDFYSVVKYISSHAKSLHIDPTKIAIAGESGMISTALMQERPSAMRLLITRFCKSSICQSKSLGYKSSGG